MMKGSVWLNIYHCNYRSSTFHPMSTSFFVFLGVDFILVSGGTGTGGYRASSSLIPVEATSTQASSCTPPADMLQTRQGHMLRRTGEDKLIACGGDTAPNVSSKKCEVYDMAAQGSWVNAAQELAEPKRYFPSAQLDDNRIWMGRKLEGAINNAKQLGASL